MKLYTTPIAWSCPECEALRGVQHEPGCDKPADIPHFLEIPKKLRPPAKLIDDDTLVRAEHYGGSSTLFVWHDRGVDSDGVWADQWAERNPSLGNAWRLFLVNRDEDVADERDEEWSGEGDAALFVVEERPAPPAKVEP